MQRLLRGDELRGVLTAQREDHHEEDPEHEQVAEHQHPESGFAGNVARLLPGTRASYGIDSHGQFSIPD
ncbi:hypothetical protein GCM10009547_28950 [Sporichthya brevicatena]|uniref:Uncharacterized protein n=1 Tax=Sporichthya brevicatena TaxID=171442 RepID=A0ABN1GYZ1_9ACTN